MAVRAGPVLLVSLSVHGAFLAAVADWWTSPHPLPRVEIAMRERQLPPVATDPIEVSFVTIEDRSTAKTPQTPSRTVSATRDASAERYAARARSDERVSGQNGSLPSSDLGVAGDLAVRPSSGTSLLRMRGADLSLDAVTAQHISESTQAPPDELHRSGKLESQPGGRAVVHDRVTTMTVEADGTAHLDDKQDIDVHFHLPVPKLWRVKEIAKDVGDELAAWYADPYAQTRYRPTSDLPAHLLAAPGACNSWGSTMCDDPLAPDAEKRARDRKAVNGGFFGGSTDITAWLHRKYVGDPYASRKLKLLDDTRDERVAMGMQHRAQQAARSAEIMTKNLERLWARERDAIARRAALFELWDECGDDDAGQRARAVVIGWIRAKLPAGSADAYTADEIAALQAHRTSATPFEPYAN